MNNPIDHKRLTSLDIKIAAAKRRAAAERATVAPNPQPTEGLTSLRSTKEKDIPLVRGVVAQDRETTWDEFDRAVKALTQRQAHDRQQESVEQVIAELSDQPALGAAVPAFHDNWAHARSNLLDALGAHLDQLHALCAGVPRYVHFTDEQIQAILDCDVKAGCGIVVIDAATR